uniref:Uncharacterized protein n=1 Tax=Pararge aegeria TaxID=116150 RepID=S4P3K2_9NEOP
MSEVLFKRFEYRTSYYGYMNVVYVFCCFWLKSWRLANANNPHRIRYLEAKLRLIKLAFNYCDIWHCL